MESIIFFTSINSKSEYKEKIEAIRKILLKAESEAGQNMVDSAFVNRYIDKIYVTPIDDGVVEIAVKIFSGDTIEKHLSALRKRHKPAANEAFDEDGIDDSRTGQIFKKMIKSYEENMK